MARVAIACVGLGLLGFGASDLLWARASAADLAAAQDATGMAHWRTGNAPPILPLASVLDVLGASGGILLVVLAVARSLPDERRRGIHLAIGCFLASVLLGVAGNVLDRSHEHEGAWGGLQLGVVGLGFVALAWRSRAARIIASAGAALLALRQPMIWGAGDAYVRATADASLAYGAELARLSAHAVGAAGALLLALALFLAAFGPRARIGLRSEGSEAPAPRMS